MAAEAIQKIKDAEGSVQSKLADALKKAKQITKNAQKEGNDKRQAMLSDAKRQRDEIIEQARSEAEKECVPLTEEGEADIAKINNPSQEKWNQAINKVVERIVKPIDR